MRADVWCGILIVCGVAVMATGGVLLLVDVPPDRYLGIVVWIVVALLVHDAVIAPIVVAIGLGAVKVRERIAGPGRPGRVAFAVAQGALLTGAVLTVIALPAIVAKAIGARNPTVLVGDYALALAIAWAIVAVVVIVALAVSRGTRADAAASARTK